MGDDPLFDVGMLDENRGICNRRVSPSHFVQVFLGSVLRFMDEEIASFKKFNLA